MLDADLLALVRDVASRVPRRDRPRYALLLTPENGARLVLRAELASRLFEAGLVRESREALRRCRGDIDALLCWTETSDDAEDGASAGFHTLTMPTSRG